MAEHERRLRRQVDGGLDRRGVGGQRAPVQFGGDDLDSRGPQAFRHPAEVLGTVVQAMDEQYGRQGVRLLT
ncbi:hypothetical protein ACZ90_60900 [Streptomyces albus subsp. albus]|uniref:hypothetical protein n=1 Tax=Streptomyces sp. SID724 TaxID=2690324 RepID=UPI000747D0EF|nr:hypothetical protein ACZ90_60900 [Streptomyces albus subsp. albus]